MPAYLQRLSPRYRPSRRRRVNPSPLTHPVVCQSAWLSNLACEHPQTFERLRFLASSTTGTPTSAPRPSPSGLSPFRCALPITAHVQHAQLASALLSPVRKARPRPPHPPPHRASQVLPQAPLTRSNWPWWVRARGPAQAPFISRRVSACRSLRTHLMHHDQESVVRVQIRSRTPTSRTRPPTACGALRRDAQHVWGAWARERDRCEPRRRPSRAELLTAGAPRGRMSKNAPNQLAK